MLTDFRSGCSVHDARDPGEFAAGGGAGLPRRGGQLKQAQRRSAYRRQLTVCPPDCAAGEQCGLARFLLDKPVNKWGNRSESLNGGFLPVSIGLCEIRAPLAGRAATGWDKLGPWPRW